MRVSRRAALALLTAWPVAARADAGLLVVASFSVIADLLRQVGGPEVAATALVGPNQDMHGFEPRPSDLRGIAAAELFVINGLGLEPWASRLEAVARPRRAMVVAAKGVAARTMREDGKLVTDPHAWQDVGNARLYVANIAAALAEAAPARAARFRDAAERYSGQLAALDAEVRATFAAIPRARRRVVTSHDALGYFGAAYGIDFHAPLGLTTVAEPSAKAVAALVRQIRGENIRALFLENIGRDVLLEQVSRETGVRIGGQLFSDALSPPAGPAATYIDMIRHNTAALAAALR